MMAVKSGGKRRCIAEINVVPYVDVMLVLLVIFMVTAPLMTQGVQVDLPSAGAKELQIKQDLPVVLTVNTSGELYLNIINDGQVMVSPDNVVAEVAAAISLNPQRVVLVKGDKNASYDQVIQAMVLLQQAGVASIGLETSGLSTPNDGIKTK